MTDTEALRRALDDADYRLEQGNSISPPYLDQTLFDLAEGTRRWLALAEGDEAVVEKVAARLGHTTVAAFEEYNQTVARAVLAAITEEVTP